MTGKRTGINVSNLVDLYNCGKSVKVLSEIFRVSRDVITRRLVEVGIILRNRSESMLLRMSQTSAEERINLVQKAHDAVRGSHRSFMELHDRANSKERCYKRFGIERELQCADLIKSYLSKITIVHHKTTPKTQDTICTHCYNTLPFGFLCIMALNPLFNTL